MGADPIISNKQMPPDVSKPLLTMLIELLRSQELPELAISGAWERLNHFVLLPKLGAVAMDLGLFELAVGHLRALGSPADAASISRGSARGASAILGTASNVSKTFAGQRTRVDLQACLSSGLFDICIEMIVAVASVGVGGLEDVDYSAIVCAFSIVMKCSGQPGCETKIRGIATALRFWLIPEHDLELMRELGVTTGAYAAKICCSVFGRDEGDSEFSFTSVHIDQLTDNWSHIVRAEGYYAYTKPSADAIFAAQLCVSDKNKPLLIENRQFLPYLVDALLLDAGHPRVGMKEDLKIWCQEHHCDARKWLQVSATSLAFGCTIPSTCC